MDDLIFVERVASATRAEADPKALRRLALRATAVRHGASPTRGLAWMRGGALAACRRVSPCAFSTIGRSTVALGSPSE